MAKPPAKKSSGTSNSSTASKKKSAAGRPAGLFTWVAVGLVVVVVLVIVVVKVTSSTPASSGSLAFQPAPASLTNELTSIPLSTFNAVGANSPAFSILAPTHVKNQPALTWGDAAGSTKPDIFFFGSEYCPFCAAQRWPTIIALSRFGTFSNLGMTQSSSTDRYPDTQTFTFVKATYTSQYFNFIEDEDLSNVPLPSGKYPYYKTLQAPSKKEIDLVTKYDAPKYIPGLPASEAGSIPFISIDNAWFVVGASYSPSTLAGLSRTQIAANLNNPNDLLTEGILTEANLLTAAICNVTNEQPSNVCLSSGVKAADTSLSIKLLTN